MSYWELNANILSTFSGLSLLYGIYVFTNFCLGVFSTLDILQNLQVRLFAFLWWYFDLVGIYFNVMYYFHQCIDPLTHRDCIVTILRDGYGNKVYFKVWLLVPCRTVLLETFEVLSGEMWCDKMRKKLWGGSATASLNRIFLCSVEFVLVSFALLTWGLDCSYVSLSFICLILEPDNFSMNR